MGERTTEAMIQIPLTVWETADSKEDLEDWLLANDPAFVQEMRELRRQDVAGEFEMFQPSNQA